MDLSLTEMQSILGISRYQISRYTTQGRLRRTRRGFYDSTSIAHVCRAFRPYGGGYGCHSIKAMNWLEDMKEQFREDLAGMGRGRSETEKAVALFSLELAALNGIECEGDSITYNGQTVARDRQKARREGRK